MIIYLCVKTHTTTGLKYLCQTTKIDPYKYLGSGKYWKLHLKKHGHEHSTEIIKECFSKAEVKEWGLYYSNLWNVVESNAWANLMEENGGGGKTVTCPWNKGKKLPFVPKTDQHKENMKRAWIKRKEEGNTISQATMEASIRARRKEYNFIHTDGTIEYNLSVPELINKYKEQKLEPSNLRRANGANTKGFNTYKGWRILTDEPLQLKTRKTDKRTLKRQNNE
jgi:hypothetical protein